MAQEQKSSIYLLLDEVGNALAQVRPQGPSATEGSLWQLVVMNDKIDEVLEYKQFKLLSIEDSSPSYEGTLVRHRNDIIQLEVRKTAAAGNDKYTAFIAGQIFQNAGTRSNVRGAAARAAPSAGISVACAAAVVAGHSAYFIGRRMRTARSSACTADNDIYGRRTGQRNQADRIAAFPRRALVVAGRAFGAPNFQLVNAGRQTPRLHIAGIAERVCRRRCLDIFFCLRRFRLRFRDRVGFGNGSRCRQDADAAAR